MRDNIFDRNAGNLSKWSALVQNGFFKEYTYEARRRYNKSAIALTGALPNETWILEVGCGSGRYHRLLKELGYYNLVSVDITIDHIRLAREINPNGIFVVASGENLPFKRSLFDALVSNAAIEHFERPEVGVQEFYRVTRSNPRVVVTSDCYSWRLMQIAGLYKSKMPIDKTMTYGHFNRMFADAGFLIETADAWGLTHYLRRLSKTSKVFEYLKNNSMSDEHWANTPPKNYLSLMIKMLMLDENLFVLSKKSGSLTPDNDSTLSNINRNRIQIQDILESPCCRSDLSFASGDNLTCLDCGATYPVIDGIPIFN